jgi:hypothetical protein
MPNAYRQLAGAVVRPTALILGAGFSKWAGNLPVAQQLFDFHLSVLNEREQRRLSFLKKTRADWDRSHADGQAEHFIKDMLRTSERHRRTVLWYLTRRLSDPFIARISGGRQVLMIDDKRARILRGVKRATKFFEMVAWNPLAGVVTPNYDLLVEYALGTQGFHYGHIGEVLNGRGKNPLFPWQGAYPILTGQLPLAKIHGSISWDHNSHYTDGRCGIRGNALIVPPYPNKPRPPALRHAWELAESILESASKLIVFGFGFNPYDKALLGLLARAGRNSKSVLLIDVYPKIDSARELWPNAQILSCPPLPKGNALLRQWLENLYTTNRPV